MKHYQIGVELVHVHGLGAVAVPRHQPREDVEVEAGQAREQHHTPVPAASTGLGWEMALKMKDFLYKFNIFAQVIVLILHFTRLLDPW